MHAQNARQRSGDDTHTENKTSEENCLRAITREHVFSALQGSGRNPEKIHVTIQQRPPAVVSQRVAQIVAQRRGESADDNEPSKMQVMFGIRQEACGNNSVLSPGTGRPAFSQSKATATAQYP